MLRYRSVHEQDCEPGDYSDIGLVDDSPPQVDEHVAGPTSTCETCGARVANSHKGTHAARCDPGDYSEYGLLKGQDQ